MVEVKPPANDAWLTAEGRQASRYWGRYRLVLVTNARDFVLIGRRCGGEAHNARNPAAGPTARKGP